MSANLLLTLFFFCSTSNIYPWSSPSQFFSIHYAIWEAKLMNGRDRDGDATHRKSEIIFLLSQQNYVAFLYFRKEKRENYLKMIFFLILILYREL